MKSPLKKHIFYSIILIFIVGFLLHFSYNFFDKNIIIGFFCPINESVWEHTKLIFTPVTIWWILSYYIYKNKLYINKKKWFTGALISVISGIVIMPCLFYFYTHAFGIENVFIDILIFLLCIITGQLLGLHFYTYSKGLNNYVIFILFILMFIMFIFFTLYPANFPIFIDSSV